MRASQRLRRWVVGLAACLLGAAAAADTPPSELEVKADYLAKFAPFVVWPQTAFAGPSSPLVICVQGADPFGGVLDRATAGQSVGAHPVIVRRVARLAADSGCQIAYVAGSPVQPQADALHAVDGQPVLTVTDVDGGGGGKGIVQLVLVNGHVRFMIDAARAAQSGLAISSKLLALAEDVTK